MKEMPDEIKLLSLVSFRLASNEDEIGIFAQGVMCALIRAFPNEFKDIDVVESLYAAPEDDVAKTGMFLFNMFLQSKRSTESIRVNDTNMERILRARAISAMMKIFTGEANKPN